MRLAAFLAPVAIVAAPVAAAQAPQAALDELLGAERALSTSAAKLPPAQGIASLLADNGLLFTRQGPVRGPAAAAANLAANPANKGDHASWHSIRGGVSGDGLQGFTLGYLDLAGGTGTTARRRYLAYWVRRANGWRVAALKQVLRAEGEVEPPAQPAALPRRAIAPDSARAASHRASLIAVEKAFSDRAQVVGLHQAFQENGRPDAIHIFGQKGFAIGLAAIGENGAGEAPGPAGIHWSADDAIVASSGDLGVTIGTIRPNTPGAEGEPQAIPFFTVWMRDDPAQPWRYIAE
jgi:hypothetical protein